MTTWPTGTTRGAWWCTATGTSWNGRCWGWRLGLRRRKKTARAKMRSGWRDGWRRNSHHIPIYRLKHCRHSTRSGTCQRRIQGLGSMSNYQQAAKSLRKRRYNPVGYASRHIEEQQPGAYQQIAYSERQRLFRNMVGRLSDAKQAEILAAVRSLFSP